MTSGRGSWHLPGGLAVTAGSNRFAYILAVAAPWSCALLVVEYGGGPVLRPGLGFVARRIIGIAGTQA